MLLDCVIYSACYSILFGGVFRIRCIIYYRTCTRAWCSLSLLVPLSVRTWQSGIVSKRLDLSWNFHHRHITRILFSNNWAQLWRSGAERQNARMSKITNDNLTRSGTGCFIASCTNVATVGVIRRDRHTDRRHAIARPRFALHIAHNIREAVHFYYRAMHFSAKRGIAIACRLSVCLSVRPSVTLVNCDHIGWNSSKIISPLVSLGRSLFATQHDGSPPFWFERRRHSIANCGRLVTDSATVTMESLYRKLPSLFLKVPSLTPTTSHSPPKWGFHIPQHTRIAISMQRVIRSTSCLVLGWGFRGRRI